MILCPRNIDRGLHAAFQAWQLQLDMNDGDRYDAIAFVSAMPILDPDSRLSCRVSVGRQGGATLKSALSSLIAWLGSFAYEPPAG